jgi:uncharacterized SAM-binding protein YcdF (DUF218 family)
MFFILSKTVTLLMLPSNLLFLLCVVGAVLMATRFKRAGKRLAIASLVLLAVAGFSPIGGVLAHTLESRFPPWDATRGPPDGIVVLGGTISPKLSRDYGEPVVGSDAGRVIAIAKLARAFPDARIVFSGGDASLFADEPSEADYLYPLLDSFGIARTRVDLESRARNTVENAVFTKDLVKPNPGERWLLVTSAQHMPRAIGCFRRIGFAVEAYPVNWHTRLRGSLLPGTIFGSGLKQLDSVTREWIGLIAYRLMGRTSELLPGPAPGP